MRIDLQRTFSAFREGAADIASWDHWFGKDKGEYTWSDIHDNPVAVVIGEAGIGKTVEFANEVERLRRARKPAFFVAINQILDNESWTLAIQDSASDYAKWQRSSDVGYFFLDSIDEARLRSHAEFRKSLSVIRAGLDNQLERVRIVISSRITDWGVKDVRESLQQCLASPIATAVRSARDSDAHSSPGDIIPVPQEIPAAPLGTFVVSLDPLAKSEALRLADAYQVVNAPGFWTAVDDGDYEFMATRPLDLEWMVRLWNEECSFGTYKQLIEGNISNRLTEVNPSYQTADAALSLDELRAGAEQLAAAAEFSGRPFVSTATTSTFKENEIAPSAVLSSWKPIAVSRLLASAIFDEETFGRVKFHHRSVREYLAASWLNRQIGQGLPFHQVLHLFSASPFGTAVLIPNHRATLCWLAAINVQAQEWVTHHFPEMFLFEGDPEAWDAIAADLAFTAYVERLKSGLRTEWHNGASEFRRIGRRLPKGRVAALLGAQPVGSSVQMALLPLVKHGHLMDCADAVFGIYRNSASSPREVQCALETLSVIASPEHRASIKEDFVTGRLGTNELIASALSVINWPTLSIGELVKAFLSTSSESEYGSGPMARALKWDLLAAADPDSAVLLLRAVMGALRLPEPGRRFAPLPDHDPPGRAWLAYILPDCLERVLTLLPLTLEIFPEVCLDAAERIEALRDSGSIDSNRLTRLHALIAERSALRWQLALKIAQSDDIHHAISRLTWGDWNLVSFGVADVPSLAAKANDTGSPMAVSNIWFTVGMNLGFGLLKGRQRAKLLSKLQSGPNSQLRTTQIEEEKFRRIARFSEWRQHQGQRRSGNRLRKAARLAKQAGNRQRILSDIERIRDGSFAGTLKSLIYYSFKHAGQQSLARVDFDVIARDFGEAVSEALKSGLIIAWSTSEAPKPAEYSSGAISWESIIGLAGLYTLLARGIDVASLNDRDAGRAAKLAVWDLNRPPSWFERLASTHAEAVCAALHPWIQIEAGAPSDAKPARGALELSLRCPPPTRPKLLHPLVQMVIERRITAPDTLESVLNALREDGLIKPDSVAVICRGKLTDSLHDEDLITEMRWLGMWMQEDPVPAWTWFEGHVASLGTGADNQVMIFANAVEYFKLERIAASDSGTNVLLSIHRLLTKYMPPPGSPAPSGAPGMFGHPIAQLRETIPRILVQTRGVTANRALRKLAAVETDARARSWLNARILEHSEQEALQSAAIKPADLKAMASAFLSEPRSEAQLFLQVVARLEEIRKGVEEGPFSDRDLFCKGMPEKHLQRWLAARFRDTQHRRFSVHREEEVDADNRTDIQLSCQYGNVCIEIKPVDEDRVYSANFLKQTLRTQIVGQYLKGYNSVHGILVLFRLDKKAWDIPGGAKRQPFTELVAYLQNQAMVIRAETHGVQELVVFGIDCVL